MSRRRLRPVPHGHLQGLDLPFDNLRAYASGQRERAAYWRSRYDVANRDYLVGVHVGWDAASVATRRRYCRVDGLFAPVRPPRNFSD